MDSRANKKDFKAHAPKVLGGPRNQFGTRVCQRVVCERCQKVDHISIRVNESKQKFCRDCAENFFSTYEHGRKIAEKKSLQTCAVCRCEFSMDVELAKKKDQPLCSDCYRGFAVWQGKVVRDKNVVTRERALLIKVSTKTSIRKNSNGTV
jgi:hypothetical protein